MRIYYAMEAQGRRCHVRTALGVDAGAWNRLDHRRVREWNRQLEQRRGISIAANGLRTKMNWRLAPIRRPAKPRLRLPRATGIAGTE